MAGPANVFVEGDNLAVLRTLAPESIDVVYADPPYNTGHDFAYRDDVRDHAGWVAGVRPVLEACRAVLAPRGRSS